MAKELKEDLTYLTFTSVGKFWNSVLPRYAPMEFNLVFPFNRRIIWGITFSNFEELFEG